MIKKLLLGLTFVTVFTFGSMGVTDNAEARRGWYGGRSYVSYYSAPRSYYYGGYYGGYAPYRSYYRGPVYGAPVYYRQPYPAYGPVYSDYYYGYGGPSYYYGPRSRVSVSFGF
jgi:hypothetical protein